MYPRLSGMTGTAWSSRKELSSTYNLRVRRIPPNRPCIRNDRPDRYFRTCAEKLAALADTAGDAWRHERPVLIGTPNVGVSETVSGLLSERSVPHVVLNAKQDSGEAETVAKAGLPGSVIVATNMAGRGTDIRLGGGDEAQAAKVRALGGLLVLGAERQRSRRVDDQLAGRAGRQGDPGESIFFVSSEDDLLRLFGNCGSKPVSPGLVRRAQLNAESLDEAQRKNVLEADDVLQEYRKNFVRERDRFLEHGDTAALLREMITKAVR
jgi:preprotein translocase subunit SecA